MFRRLSSSLLKDFEAPPNLEQLGFFVNEKDQIRLREIPEHKYQYKINRNERVNEVCKEAVNACLRGITEERLKKLGIEVLRLPVGAQANEPHVPIYVSKDFQHKKRVVVVFGERNRELGVFSYRCIRDDSIKTGSAEDFVRGVMQSPTTDAAGNIPGIVIANPGQLIWYRGGGRAISYNEYLGAPRRSAMDTPFRIDQVMNSVPGNSNFTEHVQYVFENVLFGMTRADARFDIIGLEYTGDAVIQYLASHWDAWQSCINGICLGNPQFKFKELTFAPGFDKNFAAFLATRARAYFVSDKPLETPLPGRSEHGCNCYASGEELYEDGILVKGWRSMLDWFNMISVLEDYEEPVFTMVEASNTVE